MRISPFAKSYLRRRATEQLWDACRIYKQGKMTVGDNFSARRSPAVIKYEGACRLWEVPASSQVVIGDSQLVVSQTYLSLPWDAPVPESDDIVLITKSDDPDLVGRTVSIVSVVRGGGLRGTRKFTVKVLDSKKETW